MRQIERLRNQNQQLSQLLDHEKVHSAQLKDDLVKQISSLLLNFTAAQSQSLATAIQPVIQYNVTGMETLDSFKQEYAAQAESTRENLLRYGEHVNGIQDGYQALRQEGHRVSYKRLCPGHTLSCKPQAVADASSAVESHLGAYQSGFEGALENGSTLLATSCQSLVQANETSKLYRHSAQPAANAHSSFRPSAPGIHL